MAKPRTIMRRFQLNEISAVDRPAQEHARVAILKRADPVADQMDPIIKRAFSDSKRKELADSGKALPDGSFPIETEADLHNAISAVGRAKDGAKAKAHIISRANAMGMKGALPDGWVSKSSQESTMDKELRKSLGLAEDAPEAEVVKALIAKADKAEADKKKAEDDAKEAKKAAAVSDLSDSEKSHYNGLGDSAKDTFLAKPKADRMKDVSKALEGDETLTANGVTIRKSAVGEGAFEFMKAQQIQLTAQNAEILKSREDAANATFAKRAQDELGYVTGTNDEKAAMLKAIDAISDPIAKKAAMATLTAANSMAKAGFSRIGAGGGGPVGDGLGGGEDTNAVITQKANEVQKANAGMTFAKAYEKVLVENPDLYEKAETERRARAAAAN